MSGMGSSYFIPLLPYPWDEPVVCLLCVLTAACELYMQHLVFFFRADQGHSKDKTHLRPKSEAGL